MTVAKFTEDENALRRLQKEVPTGMLVSERKETEDEFGLVNGAIQK